MASYNEQNVQTSNEKAMALNLKLLKITGIIVPQNFRTSNFKMILHHLCILGTYIIYFPVFVGQILAIYHFWGEIDIFTKTLFNTLGGLMCYIEAMYGKINSKKISDLFLTFENTVLPKMTTVGLQEKNNEIFARAKKKAHKLTWTVMIIIDLMMLFWMPAPLINRLLQSPRNVTTYDYDGNDDKKWLDFCFVTWFPYNITISPYYEVMYVLQVLMFVIATGYMKSLDMTMISMLVHVSAQFEILHTALEDMDSILAAESHKISHVSSSNNNYNLNEPRSYDTNTQDIKICSISEDIHDSNGTNSETEIFPRELNIMEDTPEMKRYFVNFIQYHQALLK